MQKLTLKYNELRTDILAVIAVLDASKAQTNRRLVGDCLASGDVSYARFSRWANGLQHNRKLANNIYRTAEIEILDEIIEALRTITIS